MPVSEMKLVTIKAPATEYKMMCFKFGGEEEFFKEKGYDAYNYIAGLLLGPNPSIMIDTVGGHGNYAVEMAGFVNANDLAAAWQWILRHFDVLQERGGVLQLEQDADEELGWRATRLT